MTIPDTATLRKALEITTKIETLQAQLQALLAGNSKEVVEKLPRKKRVSKQKVTLPSKVEKNDLVANELPSEPQSDPVKELQDELLLMEDDGMEQLALRPDVSYDTIAIEESCTLVPPPLS